MSGGVGPVTDLSCWRLSNVRGRQTWSYQENRDDEGPNLIERLSVGLEV